MKKIKDLFLICGVLMFSLILISYPYRRTIKGKIKYLLAYVVAGHPSTTTSGSCPSCPQLFYDNVLTHKLAYLNDGIAPQDKDTDLDRLSKSGTLQTIETNELFIVRKAEFSRPYILPKAHTFIQDLSKNYYNKCLADSIKYVPFTISSVTRSTASVNKLMKGNGNAIKNSAHLRGKTLDISYRAFHNNKKQTKAFIAALNELKKQNRCYVKFERNGCLHITVR
ncbi:MAG: hypothetical protein ACI87N_002031 [Flavobacteriales bacterium]|jgi:hypothetical protein